MKTTIYRLLLVAAFALAAAAGVYWDRAWNNAVPVSEAWSNQPSPVPDRIILTWNGDPATTQAVTWRTSTDVKKTIAQIAVSEDGPEFQDKAQNVDATTQLLESDLGQANYHSASFVGLTPNTMYVYRVGDGSNWSEWNQFKTASDKPDPLTFLYVGDAQNDIFSLWSRLIRMGYSQAPDARFIIHAGDLINRANNDAQWGEWFRAAGWINHGLPSVPAPGNHEYFEGDGGARTLTPHWRPQFALPENGPADLPESCYYLDIQGVRVVILNSNEKHQEQAQWLEKLLSENPNRWTICAFHHPIYSPAESRDNPELRALWQPIFDRYKVDLVLQGHDHTYARSNLMTGLNVRSWRSGHGLRGVRLGTQNVRFEAAR